MAVHVASFRELDLEVLFRVLKLRAEVFVVEQKCAYLDPDDADIAADTRHLWIAEDGEVVAYLRILNETDGAQIGRVCVAKNQRGRGLADRLLVKALEVIGDRRTRLNAQTGVQKLYLRHGFSVVGPEFLEDGIPHVPMALSPAGESSG